MLKQQVHCGLSFDQHGLSHSVPDVEMQSETSFSVTREGTAAVAGKTQDLEITKQLNRRKEVFKQSIISVCANRECRAWKVRHTFSDKSQH